MKKHLLCAVLSGIIVSPVLAQVGGQDDFFKKLNDGADAVKQQQADGQGTKAAPAPSYKDQALIERTLVDMDDGNEAGGAIVQYVRDHGVRLQLDAKLPDYPRVLSIFIAEKVTPLMLADMPDCSEKQYMALSLAVRAWLELGGDKKTLPVFEPLNGWKDQILADQFKIWLDNHGEMILYKIGQASKAPSVMELIDREKDPAKKKSLEAANRRFSEFLYSESQWRQINAFRLQ